MVKSLPTMQETWVPSLGQEDPLAAYSSILVWKIPWMEEPSRVTVMGSQRVWHNWATNTFTFICDSMVAQMIKNLPAVQETYIWSLGTVHRVPKSHKSSLSSGVWITCTWQLLMEKAMAPHSSTLAWKVPWMEKPSRLQSMGSLESDTTQQLHFPFSLSFIGEGNGNPLQCSCLENPRDGGAWWAAIYGVAQSRTRLKWFSSSSSNSFWNSLFLESYCWTILKTSDSCLENILSLHYPFFCIIFWFILEFHLLLTSPCMFLNSVYFFIRILNILIIIILYFLSGNLNIWMYIYIYIYTHIHNI